MSSDDPFNDFFSESPREIEGPRSSDKADPPAPATGHEASTGPKKRIALGRSTSSRLSLNSPAGSAEEASRESSREPVATATDQESSPGLSTSSGTSSEFRMPQPAGGGPTLAVKAATTAQGAITSQTRASYSYIGLGLLLIPTLLGYVRYWMPELRGIPFFDSTVDQLSPAMGRELARFGAVSEWQVDHSSWLASITLLGALVTFGILTHRSTTVRQFGFFSAAFTATFGLVATVAGLIVGATGAGLIGMLLLGLATAIHGLLAYRCTEREPDPENTKFAVSPPELFVGSAITLLPAISLGRAVAGQENRNAAARLSPDDFEYLWSLMWLPLFSQLVLGAAILGTAALATNLVWNGKAQISKIPLVVTTVVLIGIIVAALLPWASKVSESASVSLTSTPRDSSISEQCTRWFSWSTGRSIAIAGPACSEVRTYMGHIRTSSSSLGFSATTPSNEWLTTTGHWVEQGTVTGSYGSTVVVAGAGDPYYHSPVVLKAFDYATGTEQWTYQCGNWEPFLLTFSGSDGGDDPDQARVTVPAAGESVIVECRGATTFLDPLTGRPR